MSSLFGKKITFKFNGKRHVGMLLPRTAFFVHLLSDEPQLSSEILQIEDMRGFYYATELPGRYEDVVRVWEVRLVPVKGMNQ